MLILIPGASGNLGLHLVRSALKRGHQVRALGRDPSRIPADLLPQLESFVKTTGFDDLVGLNAGCKGADAIIVGYNGDPKLVLDGQLALLRAAERAGIKRFHAMSWNLDWETMGLGVIDSYNPFIAFHHHAKQTSSIKPVYVFSGVLAMTLFGVPGAGAMEGESAVWTRGTRGERILKVIGKGQTKTPWSVESDVADFSVALVTSNDAERGGFFRFCSDEFTFQELAATYTKVRGEKCAIEYVMDLATCKQLVKKAREEAESLGEVYLRWHSYLGLSYAICTEEGTYNPRPVDAFKFPDVKRTTLDEFIEKNEWSDDRQPKGFEDSAVDHILARIYASKQPFIIVDGFAPRYHIVPEVDELVRVTGFPTATTPFGKGNVKESYSNFHGVYSGVVGNNVIPLLWFDNCDLILRVAPLNSNVNTLGFTTIPEPARTITFDKDSIDFCGTTTFRNLHVKPILRAILDRIDRHKLLQYKSYPTCLSNLQQELKGLSAPNPSSPIDQHTFYRRISTFFRPHDLILAETGTASIGSREFVLPEQTQLINSSIWLSIGYMLPAAQGGALAQRELTASNKCPRGRTILFVGDGSLQMTVQSMSDTVRNRLDVTIFVLNNSGYTIERLIHGMQAGYNDVQPWRYLEAVNFFGAPVGDDSYPITTKRVENWGQLMELIQDHTFGDGKGLKIVEIIMKREDAPESLKKLVKGAPKRDTVNREGNPKELAKGRS